MALFLPVIENVGYHLPGMALPLSEDGGDEKSLGEIVFR